MKQRTWSMASCAAKSTLLGAGTNSSAVTSPTTTTAAAVNAASTAEPAERRSRLRRDRGDDARPQSGRSDRSQLGGTGTHHGSRGPFGGDAVAARRARREMSVNLGDDVGRRVAVHVRWQQRLDSATVVHACP